MAEHHCQAVLQHHRKVVALRMTPRSRFAILVGTNQPRSAKIMLTERGKLFEEKEPSLSDDEVSAAYENGKIAASLRGKPLATSPENIGFIAVKFALHDGSFATVLLDYFSARALATLIGSVDKIGWKTAPVLPDETRH
jgi:hypothetical protein